MWKWTMPGAELRGLRATRLGGKGDLGARMWGFHDAESPGTTASQRRAATTWTSGAADARAHGTTPELGVGL